MKSCAMSVFLLSTGLFDVSYPNKHRTFLLCELQMMLGGGSNVLPTKEEQANLLTNVQEVFEQLQLMVNIEANSTDESVVSDINRTVERAKDKLELVEELSLTSKYRSSANPGLSDLL
jgi:hypothetical protein